ncbi:MAG TPA: mandelate racemase/muconate lactonizing enzyme family protein [Calidithermus sp.]|nr:mandelate racemase/muconate lactonizing enzyme family protein [Calidithermus sp.]
MRIVALRVHVLLAPLAEPIRMAHGTLQRRPTVLVEVEEAGGVVGWGESWVNFPPWAWRERVATLEDGIRPLLLGADARDVDGLRARVEAALLPMARQWGAVGPLMQALSGVDIALWDLRGRLEGCPVSALLGGPQPARLPAYASGLGPGQTVEKAERAVAAGFRALKLKVGFDVEADLAAVAAVRAAVGPEVAVMVDANQAWTPEQALAIGPRLAAHGVRWLEEPVVSTDEHELARVTGKVGLPVAAGENVYGRRGFARLLEARAADVVQPDVAKTGGLTELRAIVGLAAEHGRPWAPHYYGGAVGAAATLHGFAACPGGLMVEWDWNENPLRDDLLVDGFDVRDGSVAVPAGPGLGIEVDRRRLARFEVAR